MAPAYGTMVQTNLTCTDWGRLHTAHNPVVLGEIFNINSHRTLFIRIVAHLWGIDLIKLESVLHEIFAYQYDYRSYCSWEYFYRFSFSYCWYAKLWTPTPRPRVIIWRNLNLQYLMMLVYQYDLPCPWNISQLLPCKNLIPSRAMIWINWNLHYLGVFV